MKREQPYARNSGDRSWDRPAPLIWSRPEGSGRNEHCYFRRTFVLQKRPAGPAFIHLFADTRYRLYVNGHDAAVGPARFKAVAPPYDRVEVGAWLRAGVNCIAVHVNCFAWGTFYTDPGCGGLSLWCSFAGRDGAAPISTRDVWKVCAATGHNPDTLIMSFALGMMEDQDTRREPRDWMLPEFDDRDWADAAPIAGGGVFGPLRPRSIGMPTFDAGRRPSTCSAYAVRPLVDHMRSFVVKDETDASRWCVAEICLEADTSGEQTLWSSSGHFHLGASLCPARYLGENADGFEITVPCEAGRNWLAIPLRMWRGLHILSFGFRHDAGIRLACDAGAGVRRTGFFAGEVTDHEGAMREYRAAGCAADIPVPELAGLPAITVQRGWREVAPMAAPAADGAPVRCEEPAAWVFDYGQESLAYIQLDFDAPPGTVLITTASERRMPDGTAAAGMQGTRLHHRVVARGGRQQWTALHPHGFRYLEIMVLPAGGPVCLHPPVLKRPMPPLPLVGEYESGDGQLDAIWRLCRDTQVNSFDDAFIDSPWRERGLYVADQNIQYMLNLVLYGDHTLMRRGIELFFQSQAPSGLVPPCTHFLKAPRHPDFSALLVESLLRYWSCSGDAGFVRCMAPALRGVLEGLQNILEPATGLSEARDREPYVDLSQASKTEAAFGLNAFVCGAFKNGARLFELVGDAKEASRWKAAYAEYRNRIRENYRTAESPLFLDQPASRTPRVMPSCLGQVLALYYEIAEPGDAGPLLDFITETIRRNAVVPHPARMKDFHFSPYSSFYLLDVLFRHGRDGEAVAYIRSEWQRMLDGGAWTCWEFFVPSHSLCHAWAASPGWYLSAYTLGLRLEGNGDPNAFVFDPRPAGLAQVSGTIPHPKGAIRVSWHRESPDARIRAEVRAPDGVRIRVADERVEAEVIG